MKRYVGMRRCKVNIRKLRIICSTSFSIRIIGSSHLFEVTSTPGVDSDEKDQSEKCEKNNETENISTVSLIGWITMLLLGTIGSRYILSLFYLLSILLWLSVSLSVLLFLKRRLDLFRDDKRISSPCCFSAIFIDFIINITHRILDWKKG